MRDEALPGPEEAGKPMLWGGTMDTLVVPF